MVHRFCDGMAVREITTGLTFSRFLSLSFLSPLPMVFSGAPPLLGKITDVRGRDGYTMRSILHMCHIRFLSFPFSPGFIPYDGVDIFLYTVGVASLF